MSGQHAPLAPSAAHRWMRCPGSYEATKDLPNVETVYSREGTFGHEIAAVCLRKDIPAKRMIGTVSPGGEFVFNEQLADAVQVYLDHINGLMLLEGGKLLVEQKVQLSPKVYGTADCLIWSDNKRHLHVIDLKLGMGTFVPVEDNEQLIIYALAALADAGIPPHLVDGVTVHIVQPRYGGELPVRSVRLDAKQLQEWKEKVAGASIEAMKPGAPRVAGDHCKFCAARGECPALREQAMLAAQEVFPDLDPAVPTAPPVIELVTTERLAKVLAGADIVDQWVKAVRKEAFERASRGEKIPGFKLVEKIGHRKWMDEKAAAELLQAFGADPYDRSIVTPAEAERRAPGAKKRISTMTVKPITGVSLAPEGDKRPAIEMKTLEQFFPLPGEEPEDLGSQ